MKEIMAMVIVGTVSYFIYKLFELYARRKERLAMIEKLSAGIDPQILQNAFSPIRRLTCKESANNSWTIRIGMLLLGVGLGISIAAIVDLSLVPPTNDNDNIYAFREAITVLYPACAAFFGGIGLISAYFIEKKYAKKEEELKN